MRFVVFGAGAVGGVVGGRLAQHGHSVVLIARGAHFAALRDSGLHLESPTETISLNVPVVDRPSAITWTEGDVCLLATKTQDTSAAIDDLARFAPAHLPIFCVQNSVANERMVMSRFPRVYGVFVWCPGDFLTPGVVRVWCAPMSGILHVGRYPSGTDALAEAVAGSFRHATFYSQAKPDIMAWKYHKLLSNLGNAVEALCGRAARGSDIMPRARREALACYHAAGISYVSDDDPEVVQLERQVRPQTIDGVERRGGSTWQSLERSLGTVETDYLNGEIVNLGRRHNIATPVNEALQRLTQQAARERWPPERLTAAEILSSLGA